MSVSLAHTSAPQALTFSPAMRDAKNYMRWVLSPFVPYLGASVLEVGIGHGGYRDYMPETSAYVGLDIDPTLVQQAQAHYQDSSYLHADARDARLPIQLAERKIDTVLCLNVLEHIAEDRDVVSNLCATLIPGGHLCIFVPAFQVLYSSLDAHAGHVQRYRLRDLKALVPEGCVVVKAQYFNALGAVGWWVNKAVKHRALDAPEVNGQLVLFDRYLVPLARLLDVLTLHTFGQSAVFVVKKL